jgi:hypothetical protein
MAAERRSDASASLKGFSQVYLLLLVFCVSATEYREDAVASFPTLEACDEQSVRYLANQGLYDDQRENLAGVMCRWADK